MVDTVHASEIVKSYFSAFWDGDSLAARQYLADGLSFTGPATLIAGADAYLRSVAHAQRAVHSVEIRKVFADGRDVCIFYSLRMDAPIGSVAVAEWYRLDGDKIASIETILDTAPFTVSERQQPPEPSAGRALDPVCHMTVQTASAAAARSHAGTVFYFCSAGCADAFEAAPETYLAA